MYTSRNGRAARRTTRRHFGQASIAQLTLVVSIAIGAMSGVQHLGAAVQTNIAGAGHARSSGLEVNGHSTAAIGGFARLAFNDVATAGAAATRAYRAFPNSVIPWKEGWLARPDSAWLKELRRLEQRKGRPGSLLDSTRQAFGSELTAFLSDVMYDIADVAGVRGISNMNPETTNASSLFAQAATTALFRRRTWSFRDGPSFTFEELLDHAIRSSDDSAAAHALADRLRTLRTSQHGITEEHVRAFLHVPEHADAQYFQNQIAQLVKERGLPPEPELTEIRSRFGHAVETFEPTMPRKTVSSLSEDFFTTWLPKERTVEWNKLVRAARRDLRKDGYAVISTGRFFPEGHVEALSDEFDYVRRAFLGADRNSASMRRSHRNLDSLEGEVTKALAPAAQAFNEWQTALLSEVFEREMTAQGAQLEFVRRSDEPLIKMRAQPPRAQPPQSKVQGRFEADRYEFIDAYHIDTVQVGASTVFGEETTRIYPDLRLDENRNVPVPEGTRMVHGQSGDIAVFFGSRAKNSDALADWPTQPMTHGSPAKRDTRLWYGLALRVAE